MYKNFLQTVHLYNMDLYNVPEEYDGLAFDPESVEMSQNDAQPEMNSPHRYCLQVVSVNIIYWIELLRVKLILRIK